MNTAPLRPPTSTWEHCLSAADALVLWHLEQQAPPSVTEDNRPHVVLLLAAAIQARATEAGLHGVQVATVALDGPGGAVDLVIRQARDVLAAAPVEAGLGEAEREQLLTGSVPAFLTVQVAAAYVLAHHAASAGTAGATIGDRAMAMSAAAREHQVRTVADVLGDDDW